MSSAAFCSFSSGKDSVLALHRAISGGLDVKVLLTTHHEDGRTSRTHCVPVNLLKAQAEALGIDQALVPTSWGNYEERVTGVLSLPPFDGVDRGIFGDIDLQAHRDWAEAVCRKVGKRAVFPLWKEKKIDLVREFIDLGYKAVIVAVREGAMDPRYLGRELTYALTEELEAQGIDACGENGEFHTFVTAGPLFRHRVDLPPYKVVQVEGAHTPGGYRLPDHWVLQFSPAHPATGAPSHVSSSRS